MNRDHTVAVAGPAPLTDVEREDLRALAAVMIPPSTQFGMPGADDAGIFSEILKAATCEGARVRESLARLGGLADGAYARLDPARRIAVAESFRHAAPAAAALIFSLVARCYYRDDRVMHALEMETRAPFPGGFTVEAGDLSLLDPVRARPKVYRDA